MSSIGTMFMYHMYDRALAKVFGKYLLNERMKTGLVSAPPVFHFQCPPLPVTPHRRDLLYVESPSHLPQLKALYP